MHCDNAHELINAWIAVEIDDVDFQSLAGHLAECDDCRASSLSWLDTDRRLTRAIVSKRNAAERVAERVLAQLPHEMKSTPTTQQPAGQNWQPLALATVAGFLLAAILFEPWKNTDSRTASDTSPSFDPAPLPTQQSSIARLVAATGPVRVRREGTDSWTDVIGTANPVFALATEIRTGPQTRCEIVTSDGNVVRMNKNTRLVVESERRVRILDGQLWCRAAKSADLEVVADRFASGNAADLPIGVVSCPGNGSCVAVVSDDTIQVHAATGDLKLVTRTGEHTINSGHRVMIRTGGVVEAEQVASALLAVGWMDSLLVRGEHSDPDLDLRVNALLAEMGRTKASFLYERELRGLGEHCVLPLTRFVQSEGSRETPARRRKSMRVIADASPSWNVENLIALLSDGDPEVRFLAATALQRLTGETNGRTPEQWRQDIMAEDPGLSRWAAWWEGRGELYPPLTSDTRHQRI